jgi:hypothetical protein
MFIVNHSGIGTSCYNVAFNIREMLNVVSNITTKN